jgi:hypothetical protein
MNEVNNGGNFLNNMVFGPQVKTTKNQLDVFHNPQVANNIPIVFDHFINYCGFNLSRVDDLACPYIVKVETQDRDTDQ